MVRVSEGKSDCYRASQCRENFKPKCLFTCPSWSQAVLCVSTPRKYPHSGYFLILYITYQNLNSIYIKFNFSRNFEKLQFLLGMLLKISFMAIPKLLSGRLSRSTKIFSIQFCKGMRAVPATCAAMSKKGLVHTLALSS